MRARYKPCALLLYTDNLYIKIMHNKKQSNSLIEKKKVSSNDKTYKYTFTPHTY